MPATIDDVVFDPAGHRYFLNDREIPGVTTLLKDVGLIDLDWVTEASRIRGTYVHAAAHAIDDDDLGDIDPEYLPYVEAYYQFLDIAKPRWEAVEELVVDPDGTYAGRLDRRGVLTGAVATNLRDVPMILDIKTGRVPPHAGIQTMGYRRCVPEWIRCKRVALWLKSTGSFELVPLAEHRDEFRFLAARELYYWKRGRA